MLEFDIRRSKKLNSIDYSGGSVVYWMQRDKRFHCNWALIHAHNIALKHKVPLTVFYSLNGNFANANPRQYGFLLRGLTESIEEFKKHQIPFHLRRGETTVSLHNYIMRSNAGYLVTDFSPLNVYKKRLIEIVNDINIPFEMVDAHNIVPSWFVSDKQEFAAHTIRRKIHLLLDEFLHPFPNVISHPFNTNAEHETIDPDDILRDLHIDNSVQEVKWIRPGEKEGKRYLKNYFNDRLDVTGESRNNPNKDSLSNLSPFIHFGQLSAQEIAIKASNIDDSVGKDAFLEQLVVRKELADNFCYYNDKYDSFNGFHPWAQKTLNEHREDKREYLYSSSQFENASTHDKLWNAAQRQMVVSGKMHGFMRMYWAKKILEWTSDPESALQIAIDLNDKYELDGRDSNGYTGIAWSIGGIHDRPWFERPVFGKVRYMNYNGCKRKFDVNKYIENNAQNAQLSI
jgi:deoxyribodipyrimidine photo-lyase